MIKTNRFTNETLCDFIKVTRADCLEFVDGCLLDNYLYGFDNGYIAIYEQFETTNSSRYYVEISDTPEDNEKVVNRWYEFQEKAEVLNNE